jgi:serine/threonine protein kinase
MSGGSEFGTRSEGDDLVDRVERFRTAWRADDATDLEPFLPALSAPHRPRVLVALIRADMELRAAAGLPVRLETYLGRFRWELPTDEVVPLLAAEYRLRHHHGDKPQLNEYRSRFPGQFNALATSLGKGAEPDTPTKPEGGSGEAVSEDTVPADFKYQLIRVVGTGAFGQVYEAEAPGGFRVALKRIMRSVDHPASRGEIEALEAIKLITHPFLLRTEAYWVFRDHIVITMELADGSLTDMIAHHKTQGRPGVPPEELIPFFEQAAEALDYLHSQNVTHRDVKPHNLLHLKGYAKVGDFGLARGQSGSTINVGAEVGTPMYMAPEVWKQKVSLHSDQYSLAASYVQARLGRPLFNTNVLHELFDKHTNEMPDLDPLPIAEQRVLRRALAKKPDRRYPSCLAFAKALRDAVLAPPKPRPSRWQSVRLIVAAVLLCGLALGLIYHFVQRPIPPDLVTVSGWSAVDEGDTVVLDNRVYPRQLTRTVAGETLIARLIPKKLPSDPKAFYMLENKVSNRVFKTEWDRVVALPQTGVLDPFLYPGRWRKGAPGDDGKDLGIDGDRERLPVLGVTLPEAMFVAEQLSGLVPTLNQWHKAVGALGDGEGDGPGINDPKNPRSQVFAGGLSVPCAVDKPTADVSVHGIHQMASNGIEWVRDTREKELSRSDKPVVPPYPRLRGQHWSMPTRLTYAAILDQTMEAKWNDTTELPGFRIVLEP